MKYRVWNEVDGKKKGFTVSGKSEVACLIKAEEKKQKLGWYNRPELYDSNGYINLRSEVLQDA
jgi:hypothetical protein